MTSKLTPIQRRKLSDEVHDRIIGFIRANDLKSGDQLPSERELMRLYEVGRPAIREAMQRLQWMGLVRIRQGERPTVADPSIEKLLDQMTQPVQHLLASADTGTATHLIDARCAFESAMARTAARRRTDEDLIALRASLDEQATARGNPELFRKRDVEFHHLIARISGNPLFASIGTAFFNWLGPTEDNISDQTGFMDISLKEHGQILEAIETGQSDNAENLMRLHLRSAHATS